MYRAKTAFFIVTLTLSACGERATEPAVDGAPPQPDTGVLGDNTTCAKADPISLYAGIASISGSTATSINEYGTSINCGSSVSLMRAPQRYYHITLTKGKSYKFTLSPDYSSARLYLFTACGTAQINVDCASKGATGDVSRSIFKSSAGTILFSPPKDGKYYLAVDGTSTSTTSGSGDFQLGVEEFKAPDNTSCSKAKSVAFSGGKLKVIGTTEGAKNEFGTGINCGGTGAFPGNQVYYKVALSAGKTYLVSFTPQYSFARIYLFRTTCTEAAINADCSSDGKTGDVMTSGGFKGKTSLVQFTPTSSGTYTIAVDASSANYSGAFELAMEEFKPPTNGTCSAASPVALSGGKATIKGSTFGSKNEFGEQVKCGSTSADGPQVYYNLGLTPGKTYKFALKPSFSAKLYIFGDHCDPAKIDVDCSSNGASGEYGYFFSGSSLSQPIYFKASGTNHKLAVDSSGDNYFGAFDLDITEFTPALNGSCSGPQPVTLTAGTTTINGDTTAIPNEFGTAINCGNYSTILKSSQVYFAFTLTGGSSYTFSLTPDYSSARFYLFGTTCDYTSINSACGSKGQSGFVSTYVSKGQTKSMTFSPTTTGTYTLAIDGTSTSSYAYGKFKLEVSTK
jgi:hypothetical protein